MKLAELIIGLAADTASLKRDFEQAKGMAESFASGIKSALSTIGVGIGVAEITEAIKGVAEYEEEIGLAAKATGMTAEQMSGLTYAAKQFDVPLHDLTMGLAYFDRVEGGLMRSKQGQTALKLLGLSAREANGQLKTAHEMLMQVADKFAGLKDSTEKTAVATALFGQTYGLELIPFLDQGSKGIKELEEKAKQLGISLDESAVQGAVKAEAAMRNLSAAMLGVKVVISKGAFPAITVLGEALSGDADAAREYADGLKVLGLELEKLYLEANPTHFFLKGMQRQIAGITRQQNDIATDQILAFQRMQAKLPDLTDLAKMPGLKITPIGGKSHIDRAAESLRSLREELAGFSEGPIAKGMAHFRDFGASSSQLATAKNLLTQIQALKDKKNAQEAFNSAQREEAGIQKSLAESVAGITGPRKEYMDTVERLNALAAKGVNITTALTLAHEKYRQELMATMSAGLHGKDAMPQLKAADDNFLLPQKHIENGFDKLDAKAQQLGKTMQSSFVGMIVEGQNYSNVLKNLTTLFAEFILKAVVFKQLSTAFGMTGFGGLIGSFFGGLSGARASGGPVTAGGLYMVGEQGPEIFSPGSSGSIIPNSAISASRHSGGNTYIDARGADAGVEARVMRAMSKMQKNMGGQALVASYEYQARGGTL